MKEQEPPAQVLPKLPRDRAVALVAAYEAGATVYQLAEQFSIHRQTVSRILKRHGATMRHHTLTADEIGDIVRAHQAGESVYRIAERFVVQASTVRKRLHEHELKLTIWALRTCGGCGATRRVRVVC